MADYPIRTTDEHGNLVPERNEYGCQTHTNEQQFPVLIQHTDTTSTEQTGVGVVGTGGCAVGTGGGEHQRQQHHGGGFTKKLHRSGSSSSSSSSSEDDEMGGRRKKKGLREKIKEKLPGRHKDQTTHGTTTTASGTTGAGHETLQPHEKKGMMEKIKEKLPGHHH